jgi:hypothetical protein
MSASTITEGSNTNLRFGTNTAASDGFDSGIDVPHPPPGPSAKFDGYFSIIDPIFPQLDGDYRAPVDMIQWSLYLKSNSEPIVLAWDVGTVPAGISLRMTGSGLDIDMKVSGGTSISAGTHSITIVARKITAPTPTPTSTLTPSPAVTPTPTPTPTPAPPSLVETWNLPYGLDEDPMAVNFYYYPADAVQITLADIEGEVPTQLVVVWYYGGPGVGWNFFKPGWGADNTLAVLVPGKIYIGIVTTAIQWEIPQ